MSVKAHEILGRQHSEEEVQEEQKVETRKCCV